MRQIKIARSRIKPFLNEINSPVSFQKMFRSLKHLHRESSNSAVQTEIFKANVSLNRNSITGFYFRKWESNVSTLSTKCISPIFTPPLTSRGETFHSSFGEAFVINFFQPNWASNLNTSNVGNKWEAELRFSRQPCLSAIIANNRHKNLIKPLIFECILTFKLKIGTFQF